MANPSTDVSIKKTQTQLLFPLQQVYTSTQSYTSRQTSTLADRLPQLVQKQPVYLID